MDFELSADQKDLQARARAFVEKEIFPYSHDWPTSAHDYSQELKADLLRKWADYGLAKLVIPKEYGGQGLGAIEDVVVLAELSRSPKAMPRGAFLAEPWPPFFQLPEALKQKYLYPVLNNETAMATCFTEPDAGSDLAGIKTTAVRKGDHYVLNGTKLWHTGHSVTSFTAVAAVTDPSKGPQGVSMFLVDNDSPGFSKVRDIKVLADRQWGVEREVSLENVVVPVENLLGKEGDGFSLGQRQFNWFRLRTGAVALGMCERSLELAVEYAKERSVFGKPLGSNQAIQWMITDSQYDIESIRWLTYYGAWMVDRGGYSNARLQASTVKAYCVDAGLRVIDRCMQVLGGRGLMIDEYPFGDFYNLLRMCKQMEGSTEVMKMVMAREMLGRTTTLT
jgi:alkylation response protein AidB-like acyl-CoA dehydrogenase